MDGAMAYRLSIADDVPATVRACAREQLEAAIQQLEHGGDADPVDAVHMARKHLKKSRALLRLVRPALGERSYRQENAALREAALTLSGTRDADALVETAAKLGERYAGRLPAADFEQLREALAVESAAGQSKTAPDRAAVAEALRAALARVEQWPLAAADWDTVVSGLTRAYARGGRAGAVARRAEHPTVEQLHAWRKRVKDLWYHERLLAPVWPEVVGAHGEQAHVLSELLGDDHDLAVLRARLERGLALPPGTAADVAPLLALIDERRAELRAQALQLGRRLYAERPSAFSRRSQRIVRAAVREQRAQSTTT